MADFKITKKYGHLWNKSKFTHLVKEDDPLSIFNNDAGYTTGAQVSSSVSLSTGSLLITASFSSPNFIFTQGDGNTFNVDISSFVPTTSSYALLAATASYFSGSITNADFATSASYATLAATASYFSGSITNAIFAETASYVEGLGPYNLIYDGTVSASVSTTGNIFLIKSASTELFKVDNGGTTTFSNNSGLTVLKVSQSGQVNFLTQSFDPTGNAPLGGFWFTSHSLYIGLE